MLPITLELRPGVDTQKTFLQNAGGVSESNLIRHKNGLIQKTGGCTKLSADTFIGTARAMFGWADLFGNPYLAIGTNELLEVESNGNITNITPITQTDNLTNSLAVTMGSSIVTVTDPGFDAPEGSWIFIETATYIGGIFLQGLYQVLVSTFPTFTFDSGTLATSNVGAGGTTATYTTTLGQSQVQVTLGAYTFFNGQNWTVGVSTSVGGITLFGNDYTVTVPGDTIDGDTLATSGTSAVENGGAVRIAYLQQVPEEVFPTGAYGAGPYGSGPYNVGGTSSGINITQWSLDQWGGDLVCCFEGSTVYLWTPPVAPENTAVPVVGAPSAVNGLMTTSPEQQVMAFGIFSATLGQQDPMLIGWCDIDDLTDWTASATNQAGTFRLSTGSKIIGWLWMGLSGLIWTDVDLWIVSYIGFPFIYSFQRIGSNSGLISRRSAGVIGTRVLWLEKFDFFLFEGGQVQPLICPVRDFIFNNIDHAYDGAVFAAVNTVDQEIAWWFPTIGSNGVCNAYVKLQVVEQLWDYGPRTLPNPDGTSLELSAWADHSVVGNPIGAFYTGFLEQFETSTDFDGVTLTSSFLTGWFNLAAGQEYVFLERILPDFILSSGGSLQVTVYVADNMNATPVAYGPFTVDATTQFFPVRARGRVMQLLIQCSTPNTFWRYGKPMAVIQPDGRQGQGS